MRGRSGSGLSPLFPPVIPLGQFQPRPELPNWHARTSFASAQMKMLFFSADGQEVQQVSRQFVEAGIPCEVRKGKAINGHCPEAELWIRNDRDCHRAFMLCVQLGIGFARRPPESAECDFEPMS